MLKFCSCRSCREGRSRPQNHFRTRRVIRSNRMKTKQNLRMGKETVEKVSVPYTD